MGMARGKSLQFPRKRHWSRLGQENVLVFCDDLHFHSVCKLVRTHSWCRNHRLGALRAGPRLLSCRSPTPPRRKCRSQYDDGNGGDFLPPLDYLGDSSQRGRRISTPYFRTTRGNLWFFESGHGGDLFHGGMARNYFDLVPADFAQLSAFGNVYAGESILEAMSTMV